jgi:hypothetical protein
LRRQWRCRATSGQAYLNYGSFWHDIWQVPLEDDLLSVRDGEAPKPSIIKPIPKTNPYPLLRLRLRPRDKSQLHRIRRPTTVCSLTQAPAQDPGCGRIRSRTPSTRLWFSTGRLRLRPRDKSQLHRIRRLTIPNRKQIILQRHLPDVPGPTTVCSLTQAPAQDPGCGRIRSRTPSTRLWFIPPPQASTSPAG